MTITAAMRAYGRQKRLESFFREAAKGLEFGGDSTVLEYYEGDVERAARAMGIDLTEATHRASQEAVEREAEASRQTTRKPYGLDI